MPKCATCRSGPGGIIIRSKQNWPTVNIGRRNAGHTSSPGEISQRLWTEHRRRDGLPHVHDARRWELLASADDLARLNVVNDLTPAALRAAADHGLAAVEEWCRRLLGER